MKGIVFVGRKRQLAGVEALTVDNLMILKIVFLSNLITAMALILLIPGLPFSM